MVCAKINPHTGRVPQISPDWTVGVEFDNAIGEGDGSLHGRRYFIAKDCFAKFLPLAVVALVDQHVGRPEPGTMISVMAAASQPGQLISIQRVSTVHVQHCFLNAPHRRPTGADILAVNTRLHCQCPNCGPCAHVVKPPTTQRLARAGKNATHMCQFSTYTCCGMESQEETMCTYTGNKVVSDLPADSGALPPLCNSWIEGAGYLSNLQAQQRKVMPEEYILGAAPEDCDGTQLRRRPSRSSSRRGSGKTRQQPQQQQQQSEEPVGNEQLYACLEKANTLDGGAPLLRAAKVVHRNSIENRYLFPTDDDPIDSTLEEDLENLSQARYGYTGQRQAHNSAGGSYGGSRSLLKSIRRSLASCLNNRQHPPESHLDARSESTFRYALNQEACKNSSEPNATSRSDQEHVYDESCGQPDVPPPEYSSSSSMSYNWRPEYCACKLCPTQAALVHHLSSSSDCGFSSASQNSINCFSLAAMSQTASPMDEQLKSQQILQRLVARLLHNDSSITEEDLLERLKCALLARSATTADSACCLHGQKNFESGNETGQTFAKVAGKIIRLHQEPAVSTAEACCPDSKANFCLETKSNESTNLRNDHITSRDIYQEGADVRSGSYFGHSGEQEALAKRPAAESIASDSLTLSSLESGCGGLEQQRQQQIGKSQTKDVDEKVDLSKAFELKLTLSINSDGRGGFSSFGATDTVQPISSRIRYELDTNRHETALTGPMLNNRMKSSDESGQSNTTEQKETATGQGCNCEIPLSLSGGQLALHTS